MIGKKSKTFLAFILIAFFVTACGIVREGGSAAEVVQLVGRAAVEFLAVVLVVFFLYW